jgi:hypothetical protein
MNTKEQELKKEKIIKRNKEIVEAIFVSQMLDHKGSKIMISHLEKLKDKYRFQDILGIKDGALSDQKGIVLGIMEVLSYFEEIKKKAEKRKVDPDTGEEEILVSDTR